MKQRIFFIILFIFTGIIFFLGYKGAEERIKENNLILQDSGYVFLRSNIIENPLMGFSFNVPVSWKINYDFKENVLEMFSTNELYEVEPDCPSIRKDCTFSVQVNDQYQEKKKLIQDIELALKTDKRPEIVQGIKDIYEILEVSGFKAVKELIFYEPEVGSIYLVSVPVNNKNYAFSGFINEGCEKTFERFLETININ